MGLARKGDGGLGWHTLRRSEVDDIPIFLEHVHFLDGLNGLDVHLLERGLELLVVDA